MTAQNTHGNYATRKLSRHAATLRYEALPAALVELTKRCVLDNLGVCLGASSLAPEASVLADYVKELGGKQQSTLLGFGGKAPAPWAAMVNGSLGHMLDYDDTGNGHVSIATVPVAFAVAERIGRVSGRDLITAIACGADVQTRLFRGVNISDWPMTEGWFPTQLLGFISGAATAGHLLRLNEDQMDNAFGIAFNQASGSRQMAVGESTHLRSMQGGFAGQGATLAADLAARGIIGSKEILEGRYGLFKTYLRADQPDWDAVVGELGTRFPLLETHQFKVWPACANTLLTNAAALQLRQSFGLRPADIETIAIIGGTDGTRFLCEPLELKRRPKSSIDGKYSIPFTTAVMMVKGNVTLQDYTDVGLRDPAVLAVADRVTYRAFRETEEDSTSSPVSLSGETTLEIRTRDGRVLAQACHDAPGDSQHPVPREFLQSKFRDCVSFSVRPIVPGNIDRAIDMILDLENVGDATEIVRLLT